MGSRVCKSLLGDRRARGERAHERALSDARPCGAGSAECSQSGFTLYRKGELFGDPCNFGSDLVTSKQLAESFPTVPHSPSNSQGKPVYIWRARALHPDHGRSRLRPQIPTLGVRLGRAGLEARGKFLGI